MSLKTIFLAFGLLLVQYVLAQDCDNDKDTKAYEVIKSLILAHRPVPALVKADSMLNLMTSKGLINCKTSLLIQLEKAEALELLEKYEHSLTLCYSIIENAKKRAYWVVVVESYISIGRILEIIGRGADCKRNLEKARKIINQYQLNRSYARFSIRYSSYHRIFENKDSAWHYAEQGIMYGIKYDIKRSQIDGNLLLGILSNKSKAAIPYFSTARDLYLENRSFYGAAIQSLNIAQVYFYQKDYKNVTIHINSALEFTDNQDKMITGSFYLKYCAFDLKKSMFETNHQLDSALHYAELSHDNHIKSVYVIDQGKINELEILKAIEDEKQEINILQKQRKLYIKALLIGLGILIIFIILLIRIFTKDKKISTQHEIIYRNNKELNTSLNMQSILLSEIHHRVKNNLQLVISMLILQAEKADIKDSKILLLDISNKITSISLIHDQLYQEGEFDRIDVQKYFENLLLHFKILVNEENFKYKININDISLNLETLLPVGIICAELITNSIKYASPLNDQLILTIEMSQDDDSYFLNYSDNGIGILERSMPKSKEGMGTFLIKSLVRQLHGELSIYNDRGINFDFKFKEKNISPV